MSHKKHGLGLFGLLAVVALGVMAFASSAQALTSQYLVGGAKVAAGLNAPLEGNIVAGTVSTLLLPKLSTSINCSKFSVGAGTILSGPTKAEGSLLFEECTALVIKSPEELAGCEIIVSEASKNFSHHVTATGIVLPAELTSGEPAVLVEKISALILFKKGLGCVLPLDNTVTGEVCLKIINNETVKPTVEGSDTIACKERKTLEGEEGAGVKDKLLYGAQEASIDGKAEVFLGGGATHKGKTLGVKLI